MYLYVDTELGFSKQNNETKKERKNERKRRRKIDVKSGWWQAKAAKVSINLAVENWIYHRWLLYTCGWDVS